MLQAAHVNTVFIGLHLQPRSYSEWACARGQREGPIEHWAYRFPVSMVEELPAIEGHTRFHRQFVTLIRKHAAVVAADDVVHPLFQRHCFIAKEQCAPCASPCLTRHWSLLLIFACISVP